jgi:hypothetical protein
MISLNRIGGLIVVIFLFTLISICYSFIAPKALAITYGFDEGIEVLTEGLISERGEILRNKKIAVFGIIESRSRKKLEVSSHIEDGIMDELVNQGYTVIERRRIEDVIKKEIKKSSDWWFDETEFVQFGKLVGAEVVVTGRYVRWKQSILKVSIRAIRINDGKILAANKVRILTDGIVELLKPEENEKDLKKAKKSEEVRASEKSRTEPIEYDINRSGNNYNSKPFIGEWRGKTWCADPKKRSYSFKFRFWMYNNTIMCGDYSKKNKFLEGGTLSDEGNRYRIDCSWSRPGNRKYGTYVFFTDKDNPNCMYGYENTTGVDCKRYEYEMERK